MVNYRQRQQALRKGLFGSPLLSACLLTLPVLVSAETARADIQRPGEQFRTAQRPRHRHPNATGPPAPGHRQIACCCRGRKAARSPHPSQDVQAKPRHLSLASQHYRHGLLGGGRTHGTQSGSQPQKLVGFRMAGKLRRLRQPGSRLPHEGLPPENIHPPAKPLLRGAPL